MSIYGSTWDTDADDHADGCARWLECACTDALAHSLFRLGNDNRHWLYLGAARCTCRCGPIVYQGSDVLPSGDDPRGGSLGLAEIAGFITRDGRDDGPEDEDQPWPYLRVTMWAEEAEEAEHCQDVVLDRPLVVTLRDYLSSWLERTAPAVVDIHLPEGA